MPNHIINYLQIDGENKQEVLNFIRGEESDQYIDFQKIVPMPAELDGITSPVRIVSEEESKKGNGITKETHDALVKKYGHADWYNWRLSNWGTKWNAYDQSFDGESGIVFQTAWSTPFALLSALSLMFPETNFCIEYADEDLGFNCGSYTILGGHVTTEEGDKEFAMSLWGIEEDEEFDEWLKEENEEE